MNLLSETRNAITKSNHTARQIIFIGSEDSGHRMSWESFETLADQEYNNDYGHQEVATDLIIVFSDGSRLFRPAQSEYSFWSYIGNFVAPPINHEIKTLFAGDSHFPTLANLNK